MSKASSILIKARVFHGLELRCREVAEAKWSPPLFEAERRARIRKIRLEKGASKAAKELEKYDPHKDPNVTGDPYKTLFVARLNYETTEHRMKREFEAYGPIKCVSVRSFLLGAQDSSNVLHTNKLMEGSWIIEQFLWTLSMAKQFQTGDLEDWVAVLGRLGLEAKTSIRRILEARALYFHQLKEKHKHHTSIKGIYYHQLKEKHEHFSYNHKHLPSLTQEDS